VKPVVKWAGGKSKLLGELLARVPDPVGTYIEPFAGGAALFFALAGDCELPEVAQLPAVSGAKKRPSRAKKRIANNSPFAHSLLCDRNEDLITFYTVLRDDPEGLIRALSRFKHDEELYYKVRAQEPERLKPVARAARFSFLNRTCFNGLWRVNKKGLFNVPFGRYKNPKICDADALRRASLALAQTELTVGDFQTATHKARPGDFVYLDPPYVPLSKSAAFTAYASGGFTRVDQDRLRDELVRLRARGVYAMLSNADTPETRELYGDFCAFEVRAPRAINARGSGRGDANELLVVTWGEPGVHRYGVEGGPPSSVRVREEAPAAPIQTLNVAEPAKKRSRR
jgi:DNA adenine methylase